ncbi:uncharacterized protein LOC129741112 [Uranotaenia lowii]|uniref:uncharacterized protein LOC129741112 n=1 Tax=Uranotaenia lowii TaxID=190385 RepID=UPI00247A05C0|nr:uncharacterized protein LOC129741112 [Uranotaenia lowii]
MVRPELIFLLVLVLGLASASSLDNEISEETKGSQENLTIIQKFCIRESGSDVGYQKYRSTLGDLDSCIKNNNNSLDISLNFESLTVERIKSLCPVLKSRSACFDGFAEATSKCVTDMMLS